MKPSNSVKSDIKEYVAFHHHQDSITLISEIGRYLSNHKYMPVKGTNAMTDFATLYPEEFVWEILQARNDIGTFNADKHPELFLLFENIDSIKKSNDESDNDQQVFDVETTTESHKTKEHINWVNKIINLWKKAN